MDRLFQIFCSDQFSSSKAKQRTAYKTIEMLGICFALVADLEHIISGYMFFPLDNKKGFTF